VPPLHHSSTDYTTNSIGYGIFRQLSASATLRRSALHAVRPSTRWGRELTSAVARRFSRRSRPARPDFPARAIARSAGAAALFHDERRRTPMTVVASCRSSLDDDISASPTTRRASLAYPTGNGLGSIDKLSSSRTRRRRFPQLAAAKRPCNAAVPNNKKRRALARSAARSRHRGYVSETIR
jgi:hypothetical protein